MKIVNKILFLLIISTLTLSAEISKIDECKSDLYYANGIMGETEDKMRVQWQLTIKKLLLVNPEIKAKIKNVNLSYNTSQFFLDDLLESFEQVMSNEWGWKDFTNYFSVFLTTMGVQESWVPHLIDLTKQVNSYKENIKDGHSVIVIAHSQGNYFTNESYDLLDDWMKSYFKMMGVATPANHVAGFLEGDTSAPYVTFHNDMIMSVVTGLPSNRDNPNPNHNGIFSIEAHDFYGSYLTAENTKGDILGFIETKVEEHATVPSQWETDQEFNLNTCEYKITVKHRYDPSIEMGETVYPFAPNKKLYQVSGEWVKASCGGENILGEGHDIPIWDGKKENECLMVDNPQEEKIAKESCKDPSLFEVISQTNQNTSTWRVTVKNNETNEIQENVYPFNLSGSLYQVESGEWVLASCGGTEISSNWIGQKENELYMIDNLQEEKIVQKRERQLYYTIEKPVHIESTSVAWTGNRRFMTFGHYYEPYSYVFTGKNNLEVIILPDNVSLLTEHYTNMFYMRAMENYNILQNMVLERLNTHYQSTSSDNSDFEIEANYIIKSPNCRVELLRTECQGSVVQELLYYK